MCVFSRNMLFVGATRIFARAEGDWQVLAYGMVFESDEPVAMVLPLPLMPSNKADPQRFVDVARARRLTTGRRT